MGQNVVYSYNGLGSSLLAKFVSTRGVRLETQERPTDTVTVLEVAAKYGVNPETVRRWVREGKLAARRLGNVIFMRAEDVEALIEEKQVGTNGR